jgi:Rrf2 family protein
LTIGVGNISFLRSGNSGRGRALFVSQKCQYALRAVFELAKREGEGPVKVAEIAEAQAIPPRFLEVILNELRQAGFVESRRGSAGGYVLARDPDGLTVGDVLRFLQGEFSPVDCIAPNSKERCRLYDGCVFLPMWQKVRDAVGGIYDATTFRRLVEEERRASGRYVPSYAI